jgi:L,D-peptidoglycan transpeptidase YkuD (ErfK/YbiS/YcfS/YnhG family)
VTPGDLVLTGRGVRFRGRVFPCSVGRGGVVTKKREGDGGTPAGVHRITGMLYRGDRLACPAPWADPIGPRDLWSDDSDDPAYNTRVVGPHGYSHERLRRADPLYDLILLTDWNAPPATAGKGSAIFLHQWRRPRYPTEGCIAFRRDHLAWIAARINPGCRVVVHGDREAMIRCR